jgi:hypothetical protein
MTWWSVALVFAVIVFYKRARVQYEEVKDVINVEAMPGDVQLTIKKYEAIGYKRDALASHGRIQRITLSKNVRYPKARPIW